MEKNSNTLKNFTSIVTVDAESLHSYKFERNEIKVHNLNKSSRNEEFFISYIKTRDVISSSLEVSRAIPDEDLQDAVEIKAYDELGLDPGTEYKISYFEAETNDTSNRLLNVLAIDANLAKTQFEPVRAKTRYLDYVTAAPFLIRALYQKNVLEDSETHCFVYFQKKDSFLAVYRGGKYVYSKSLRYSLHEISEKFCELLGERIEEEDFYTLLSREGMKLSNPAYQQYLMQLFGEVFLYINDVLIFAKRGYGIDVVDRFYIGSEIGIINGIEEYSKSYLGLESFDFNFNIAINSKEWYVDQMHILMVLAAQAYLESPDDAENFTIFKRPPAFLKRPSGKLFAAIGVALLLTLAYPAFQVIYGSVLSFNQLAIDEEYQILYKKNSEIKSILESLEAQKTSLQEKRDLQNERLNFRKKLLNEIHDKKAKYPMKGVIIDELVTLINSRGIKIEKIEILDGEITLSLLSKNEKRLTELLKDISHKNRYAVSTKEISKKEARAFYTSDVSVKVQ
ncbi:MAG: hypothetical protein GX780_02770 [Campylobacteraceae bacterium]|nr:hypothetical protein [Campylobacteraceae bacterium]